MIIDDMLVAAKTARTDPTIAKGVEYADEIERRVKDLREAIAVKDSEKAAFAMAWAMQAFTRLLADHHAAAAVDSRRRSTPPRKRLARTDEQILEVLAKGGSVKEQARELDVKEATMKKYRRRFRSS